MEEAGGEVGRGKWSTAFALTLAVLLFSVFDGIALVLLPLALLVFALPTERPARWIAVGVLLSAFALLSVGPLATVSRGWALMTGSIFLGLTLAKPAWGVTTRALTAIFVAMATGFVGLSISGAIASLDALVRGHFEAASAAALADMQSTMPNAAWLGDVAEATERIAAMQGDVFPALLALQTLAALALCSWWVRRVGRSDAPAFRLGRLRDFRFNDNLIWLLIGGLLLLILPTGPAGVRVAANALVFMGALYAMRGLAVFVFMARGAPAVPTVIFGLLAFIFLSPFAVTGALVMGVGDTWLDVRGRAALAA